MSGDFPEPLTPPDCDLRDFLFMPLDVLRLRDSDIAVISSGDEFRCAVLLWCASWHQIPAGSLPDNDVVLSDYAGFGRVIKEWKKVREGAMRGWIKCKDGRWYHPVVCEKANEAWRSRLEYREKKETERIRKAELRAAKKAQDDAANGAGHPQDNLDLSGGQNIGVPKTNDECPPDIPPLSAGNHSDRDSGQGQWTVDSGELTTKPKSADTPNSPGEANLNPDDSSKPKDRNVQVAVVLRALGIRPMTSLNVFAIEWARNPDITDQLLTDAVAKARKHNTAPHISPNYLAPIIVELLNPKDDMTWRKSNQGIDAKGRELGMQAGRVESYPDFAKRISAEIRRRKGGDPTEGGIAA